MWLHVWVRDFKMLGNFAFLSILVTFYMEIAVIVQVRVLRDVSCSCERVRHVFCFGFFARNVPTTNFDLGAHTTHHSSKNPARTQPPTRNSDYQRKNCVTSWPEFGTDA